MAVVPDLRALPHPAAHGNELAVMLTGGGARAAYQVGLLRGLARRFPDLRFDIVTGVSAGAINATFLAAAHGSLIERATLLSDMWCELECHHVFRPNYAALLPFQPALASLMPKWVKRRPHGLFDTTPLVELLRRVLETKKRCAPIEGIKRNIREGSLKAVALMTLDYTTGQSVRWVQGRTVDAFEGPNRRTAATELTVEHVLASAALPFVFPAVRIGERWYGDGGIRLSAPLSAAVHLGAKRILAMSTGYQRTPDEACTPLVTGYPPAAQLIGQLVNAVFLDVIDEDVTRMQRMNGMLEKLEPREREGFKPIDLCVLRPSRDLGKLAGAYEKYLPRGMRAFTRLLGTRETESPDFVSLLMFEPNYTRRLIEIGEEDVDLRIDELRAFLGFNATAAAAATG